MLVLSRRQNQKICFPHLGIDVEILKLTGGTVRVGVSAPSETLILRGELPQPENHDSTAGNTSATPPIPKAERESNEVSTPSINRFKHDVRDRLNVACLMLEVLQRKIDTQQWDEAQPLIDRALRAFDSIDQELAACPTPKQQTTSLSTPRVLIVEDNANEGQLLVEYLTSLQCQAHLVNDGRQALHYLRQHGKPDVVLLDMNMPNLDGPSTIRLIREQSEYDGLRIFGVSGSSPEAAGVEVGPQGADRWYRKPIRASQLVRDIQANVPHLEPIRKT